MNNLKTTLFISAIGFLLAVPFIVLPFSVIENIFVWFGIQPISDSPITLYLFRIVCGVSGFIGVFFIILAKNPLQYGYMLNLGGYGLLFFGLLSLTLGFSMNMPVKLYIGDTLFGLVLGLLILKLSKEEIRNHRNT